ncbi:solute carrier family 41 member 1 [Trichonephila clavipes]|uniref:Solute carrier family 41 member 1 n=1 Tax=Trichonephila inaurata madagascariensis TaxID=2747483 RepID=A0A8X6IEZ9_9ARAC|nr:solute carrier family 41 member 1 [Trichonephila inaurata madagascariensis]GFS74990.1 solute carrier family 41 member 1 [Trichonephila clavipes]
MQNQCLKLQGSECEAGLASTANEDSGHPEAALSLQPCCSQALVDKHRRRVSYLHRLAAGQIAVKPGVTLLISLTSQLRLLM